MGGEVVVTMGMGDDPYYINDKVMAIMEINDAVSKFRGFSVWCAAYSIFFCVATIIIYWDVNLGGAILCVIPPLLVSSLLLLWVHTYTVKLMNFYLINPPLSEKSMRDRIFNNVACRTACTSLCIILPLIILPVVHAEHWNGNGKRLMDRVGGLSLILVFVLLMHQNCIGLNMDMNFHPSEIKQQLQPPPPPPPPPPAAAAAAAISSTSNQSQQQQPPPPCQCLPNHQQQQQQEPPCLPNHQQKEETNNNGDLIVGSTGSGPTAPPILLSCDCSTSSEELFYRKQGVDCREHERADPIDNNHDKIVLGSNVSVPSAPPILLSCDCSTSEEFYRKEREDLIDIIICHISDDEEKTSSS